MLEQLREEGVVVIWKLDRLSRSLKDMLVSMERIDKAGAGFKSLTEVIDTPGGGGLRTFVGFNPRRQLKL